MKPISEVFSLVGKVALVTGAARGIGLACAERLAEAGALVLMTDINSDEVGRSAETLSAKDYSVLATRHDVSVESDWQSAVQACIDNFGGLDVLLNNAGIFIGHLLETTTVDEVRTLNRINVESVFLGMKHASAVMKPGGAAGNGGSIINLSSAAGQIGVPGHSAYGATKGAVRLYTKHAAVEFGRLGYNIRVNSVHPGPTDTDMGDQVYEDFVEIGLAPNMDEARKVVDASVPLGRTGTVEDVANAVLFLASGASSYVTGVELTVDGGITAG